MTELWKMFKHGKILLTYLISFCSTTESRDQQPPIEIFLPPFSGLSSKLLLTAVLIFIALFQLFFTGLYF